MSTNDYEEDVEKYEDIDHATKGEDGIVLEEGLAEDAEEGNYPGHQEPPTAADHLVTTFGCDLADLFKDFISQFFSCISLILLCISLCLFCISLFLLCISYPIFLSFLVLYLSEGGLVNMRIRDIFK